MSAKYSICEEWEDFWKYVKDIGERPSSLHQLRRIDNKGNYSPDNCKWVETKPNQKPADYQKQYRKDNPEKIKNNELQRRFGITLEDYNKMLEDQNGCCKICNVHHTEEKQALSVDHCHTTQKIRGLLCNTCNRAIGLLKDNTETLQKAIEYLNN